MRILVSGATGFIGRAFCQEAVRRGHQILAITRDPAAQIAPDVEIAVGSLAETPWKQVARFAPDVALHLAWFTGPGEYLRSSENELWLELSKTWFRRLIELGVLYVAGTGTCIEYAASKEPLNEDKSPLAPLFSYSKAKVALFEWLREFSDVDWSWFRVFYPYGSGEHPERYTSMMVSELRAGKTLSINTPGSIRDYIEIRDTAAAFCHAIESRLCGAVNVGTGSGICIASLALRLAGLLRADVNLIGRNPNAAYDPTPVIVADTGRLRRSGWKPLVGIDEGLQRLIDSMPLRT
ncbi:NAD-dependent epimerase/dehydratase family protein [Prosthecobacter sp.]|jgi:nucleoside-diphosphate-sugar epimerase|uniref:NAD-dependent epimerase/dehydratase family protein n=1 Tax=Prosthecobacter sp. TaxID=1965333 RepID=UPI0037C62FF1